MHTDLAVQISQEEYQEILAKLNQLINTRVGNLTNQEEELYLEQQLNDLLGFSVAIELEEHRLPHNFGVIHSGKHLPRSLSDQLVDHQCCLEAGLSKHRSFFGWFLEQGQLTEKMIEFEKYYLGVQLPQISNWSELSLLEREWYKWRKVVVINPVFEVAVVGVLANLVEANWIQYQFTASPEIIRQARLWSMQNNGKTCMLFVDDPNDQVSLGVKKFHWLG